MISDLITDQITRIAARVPLRRWVMSAVIRRLIQRFRSLWTHGIRLYRFLGYLGILVRQNSLVWNHGYDGFPSRARTSILRPLGNIEATFGAVVAVFIHRNQFSMIQVLRNRSDSTCRFHVIFTAPFLRRLVHGRWICRFNRIFRFISV